MDITPRANKHKPLGMFSLIMINVIAVDSLRSLTVGVEYGFSLLFFYALAALLFFIPTILISAELATGWPNTGGAYIWIREAFGPRWGFLAIWLQWIYNVVWYPTIFAFIAGVLAYLINPALADNKYYVLAVVLGFFWALTFLNCLGMRVSSWISIIGALLGSIFPMLFIAGLGFGWLYSGKPSQIHFSANNFFPNISHLSNLAFFTNILFGLMGMEMSAVHAGDVRDPVRNYPKALAYSGVIILFTLVSACLAIAIVIPLQELNLVSGLIDAYGVFFKAYHINWFTPIIALLIIIGSLSGASAWIIGPVRGLLIASEDNNLPQFFTRVNNRHMPVGILLFQGLLVTILCAVFLVMPDVNSSYWVLSNLTAQLALIFYLLLFAAAIRLHHKSSHVKRAYKIPGGAFGIWLVGGMGIFTCIGVILIGFFPPTQITIGKVWQYEAILVLGILIACLAPLLISAGKKNSPR